MIFAFLLICFIIRSFCRSVLPTSVSRLCSCLHNYIFAFWISIGRYVISIPIREVQCNIKRTVFDVLLFSFLFFFFFFVVFNFYFASSLVFFFLLFFFTSSCLSLLLYQLSSFRGHRRYNIVHKRRGKHFCILNIWLCWQIFNTLARVHRRTSDDISELNMYAHRVVDYIPRFVFFFSSFSFSVSFSFSFSIPCCVFGCLLFASYVCVQSVFLVKQKHCLLLFETH